MIYKHSVYQGALNSLWEAELEARRYKNLFWGLADELVGSGLVSVEDVAEVYGVSAPTARKRMQQWRDRVTAQLPAHVRAAPDGSLYQTEYCDRNDR